MDPSEPSTTEVKSTESIGTTEVNEDTDADGVTEEMPDNRVERDKDNSKTVEETIKDVLPETSEANKDNVESIKTSERLSSLISE